MSAYFARLVLILKDTDHACSMDEHRNATEKTNQLEQKKTKRYRQSNDQSVKIKSFIKIRWKFLEHIFQLQPEFI